MSTGVQPSYQVQTRGRRGDSVARNGILQPSQPGRVLAALREQTVAAVHGGVMCRHLASMTRLECPDQSVEEAAPAGRTILKQSVHLRRQPDGGYQTAISAWPRGGAPSRRNTRRSAPRARARADVVSPSAVATERQPPRRRPTLARQVGVARAAQAAAGNQQRKRLQQVGLAAAIRPVQHADPGSRPPCQRGVAAKVGDRQAVQAHVLICGRFCITSIAGQG